MQEIVKVAFLGIVIVLLAVQFKSVKAEYSIYIGLALGILLFGYGFRQIGVILPQFEKLWYALGAAGRYLGIILKVIGITYVCEFSASICRDAGYQAVAAQIEILGKLSVMFAGLPILFAVIEQIELFL